MGPHAAFRDLPQLIGVKDVTTVALSELLSYAGSQTFGETQWRVPEL